MEKQNFGFGMRLNVQYCYKDKVKAAGARWNNDTKTWYCPSNVSDTSLNQLIELKDDKKLVFSKQTTEEYSTEEIRSIFKDYKAAKSLKPKWSDAKCYTKFIKEDKIDYTKLNEIKNQLKHESYFDSEEEEASPLPKIEYDYPQANRSAGEYDCFPNYHPKGGY
jgi:hypothetical protein